MNYPLIHSSGTTNIITKNIFVSRTRCYMKQVSNGKNTEGGTDKLRLTNVHTDTKANNKTNWIANNKAYSFTGLLPKHSCIWALKHENKHTKLSVFPEGFRSTHEIPLSQAPLRPPQASDSEAFGSHWEPFRKLPAVSKFGVPVLGVPPSSPW